MDTRYCLLQDDSGHWYLCPHDRRDEGSAALEAIEAYWRDIDIKGPAPTLPPWVKEIDGPHLLSFTDPAEED